MLVVVDGLDGSGKSTVVSLVSDALSNNFRQIQVLHFPAYDTITGSAIKELLHNPPQDQFLMTLLFEVNRREELETLKLGTENPEVLILCDRYYHSGLSYAYARGLGRMEEVILGDLTRILPQPDLSFILDIDPKIAARRMAQKVKDKLESDTEFQWKVRKHFLLLSQTHGWTVLDATSDKTNLATVIVNAIKNVPLPPPPNPLCIMTHPHRGPCVPHG